MFSKKEIYLLEVQLLKFLIIVSLVSRNYLENTVMGTAYPFGVSFVLVSQEKKQ